MEFFFFLDVYADRYLVDYYILAFKLRDTTSVVLSEWEGRKYIDRIRNWERFVKGAYDIVLYELGDEIERFKDIDTALREGYKIAYREASRRGAKEIVPAIGPGNPPVEVVFETFPESIDFDRVPNTPSELDKFLENVAKEVNEEPLKRGKDDDGIAFPGT
jgi:hypothetical protein